MRKKRKKNPLYRGNVSEAKALSKLIELGYNVFMPFGGGTKTDYIIEHKGELLKVQVKTGRLDKRGSILFRACSMKRGNVRVPYKKGEVDVFLVVYKNQFYFVPVASISGPEQRLCLSDRVQKNSKYAEDFRI